MTRRNIVHSDPNGYPPHCGDCGLCICECDIMETAMSDEWTPGEQRMTLDDHHAVAERLKNNEKPIRPTQATVSPDELQEIEAYVNSTEKTESVGMGQMREMMREFKNERRSH